MIAAPGGPCRPAGRPGGGPGWLAGLLIGVGVACGPGPVQLGQAREAVVYGADDRREVYEHPDPTLVRYAKQAVVGIVVRTRLDSSDPADVQIERQTLGTLGHAQGLCPDVRFADQPIGPRCSGVLIGDDVVLTAGHCVRSQADCEARAFVFGYYYAQAGQLAPVTTADVFRCKRLLVQRYTGAEDDDYALIRLDRAASPRFSPVPYRVGEALRAGEAVAIIGFPAGLPMKIDSGGQVLRDDYPRGFSATLDAFAGSSGSGVFDAQGQLVGTLVKGGTDFIYSAERKCQTVVRRTPNPQTAEGVAYLGRALQGLCGSGQYGGPLCGTPDRPDGPLPPAADDRPDRGGCACARTPAQPDTAWIAGLFFLIFGLSRHALDLVQPRSRRR